MSLFETSKAPLELDDFKGKVIIGAILSKGSDSLPQDLFQFINNLSQLFTAPFSTLVINCNMQCLLSVMAAGS